MNKNILVTIMILLFLIIWGCENNSITPVENEGQLHKLGPNTIQLVHIMKDSLISVNGDQSSWALTLRHCEQATLDSTYFRAIIKLDGDVVDNTFGGWIYYDGEVDDTSVQVINFDACLPETFEAYDYRIIWYSETQTWLDAKNTSAFHPNFQECASK